jgi:hypothetical protein
MRFCSLIMKLETGNTWVQRSARGWTASEDRGTHRMKSEMWSRRMLTDSASMLVWAMKLGRLTTTAQGASSSGQHKGLPGLSRAGRTE